MNKFWQALSQSNVARTLNNAVTNRSTLSGCLNLFAQGGSLRNQSPKYIQNLFATAWQDNPQHAIQMMGWIYDCRGGCGERDVFFYLFTWLTQNYPEIAKANLYLIPDFGRWDMLVRLLDFDVLQPTILQLIHEQLLADQFGINQKQSISLCAKWLPREGKKDEAKAKLIRHFLELSAKDYRHLLTRLTRYLDVVETKMCAQQWEEINYENVSSRAAMIYRQAFQNHDSLRYNQYLEAVKEGKASLQAKQLYPYDIIRKYLNFHQVKFDPTLELQWQNLPNPFAEGNLRAIVPVVDVSGSMYSFTKVRPIDVSVSLGVFFAEKNPSIWGNSFITFSGQPELLTLTGNSLYEKVKSLSDATWGMNTNLQAVFNLILFYAKEFELSDADLPQMVLIISDMEFDQAQSSKTNFQAIDEQFQAAGYTRPTLVFWNVDAKSEQFPVTKNDEKVVLLSGFSQQVFRHLMSGEILSPMEMMLKTIDTPKYQRWQAKRSTSH